MAGGEEDREEAAGQKEGPDAMRYSVIICLVLGLLVLPMSFKTIYEGQHRPDIASYSVGALLVPVMLLAASVYLFLKKRT